MSWSTGLRLDEYVLHGRGDPRQIMRDEFQNAYRSWNNTEYLALVEWMRAYNRHHPHDTVRFMGNDFGYAGPELYDLVTDHVTRYHPELLPRIAELYRGLRPTTDVDTHMSEYLSRSPAERGEMAVRTGEALELLRRQPPGPGAERLAHLWAVRHARAIDQTARGYAFDFEDPEQIAAAMLYRDRVMADNVLWWHERTGDKILLSAHNAHVAYDSYDPRYPKTQEAFLRDRLGEDYVSIGFTFHRGSFRALGADDGRERTYAVGPARPGSNEHTLDRVRHRDYVLDLRTVPEPARAWLAERRPTRSIGGEWPEPEYGIALGRAYDILVHLHRVRAAGSLNAP